MHEMQTTMDATVTAPCESSPSCNASASIFEAYMRQLHDFHRDNPIGMRGDVLALSLFFDGDWARFVRAWGLREPLLVRAFYYNHDQAYSTEVMIRYKYMPRLLRHQMKPSQVQAWDKSKVNLLAQVLERAVKSGTVKDYKLVCKVATQIPGIGTYSKEHLFRTACLIKGTKHPSPKFVTMGSGANNARYAIFRDHGVKNIAEFNAKATSLGCPMDVDAGELAYLVCMVKSPPSPPLESNPIHTIEIRV